MQPRMNTMFTTKLGNDSFARLILDMRIAYENEIERLVNYRENNIISTNTLIERTNSTIEHYDKMLIKEFNQLDIAEKIRLIATWKEFSDLAEQGVFEGSDILLLAARIVK